ncbi:esterase-like activity of phytase family protein [Streptomyces sp. NPDC048277]|uniref:caspase, EACC1-associated type n=1 Tax=Streptomyces sp. NPDC048277 TaxID=3155027 RepID=UPI0033EBE76C
MTDAAEPRPAENPIDPERSVCVLIGVDDYRHLDKLRSVQHNLTELQAALMDPSIWGIPGNRIRKIANPSSPAELVGPITEAAELAEDALIVYYAGHGLIDRNERQLLLTLPESVEGKSYTSVRSSDVRRAIRDTGTAPRRVLILDCCFSGQVLTEMTDGHRQDVEAAVQTLRDVEGSYVMTSATRDRPSHAPDPDDCTLFTGALVDVMRKGQRGGPEMLSLHDLFVAVKERIRGHRPEIPQEPQAEDHNGVGRHGFVRNVAVLPRVVIQEVERPHVPTRWERLRTPVLSLTAGALGLALGLGTQPLVHWWHDTHPAPAAGPCAVPSPDDPAAPRADLLDHSDELNSQSPNYEKVKGLSALALSSQGKNVQALVLGDNDPGRYWPVSLGSPFHLNPSVSTARSLILTDGEKIPNNWYDGEAMAIENGGTTMLIGSETGPAIRRFDIKSGMQVGKDFPIPKHLRYYPEGAAETGRSIESLAVSPDGRYVYAGWEAPLADDGDQRGRGIIRIQRYKGASGQDYVLDGQYAFLAEDGMFLSDLSAIDDNGDLLGLERQYTAGQGSAIRVVQLALAGAKDVTDTSSLWHVQTSDFAHEELVVDLATCPVGGPGAVAVPAASPEHPLLDNVEGMALGTPWKSGRYKGWRPMYMVSDNNDSVAQITRLYSLAVKLRS